MTADDLPLPTLLSRLLIAFTIEFDNEAEHRLEHRTMLGAPEGGARGPWLVSQAQRPRCCAAPLPDGAAPWRWPDGS